MVRRAKLKEAASPPTPTPPQQDYSPTDNAGSADDAGLLDDLLAELDSRDPVVQQKAGAVITEMQLNAESDVSSLPSEKKSSKRRFKERGQRKAQAALAAAPASDPEADARLEKEAKEEEKTIGNTCNTLGLQMFEIPPDGHCLYAAVADQLAVLGILSPALANYKTTRLAAADYMYTHPDDFIPFLPSIDGEDGVGATDSTGLMTQESFKIYCLAVRDTGVWGGEPEITALSRAYKVPIHVIQSGQPPVVKHSPPPGAEPSPGTPIVFISYHRRMYGLGEHYNSLRPKVSLSARLMDKLDKSFGHAS